MWLAVKRTQNTARLSDSRPLLNEWITVTGVCGREVAQ